MTTLDASLSRYDDLRSWTKTGFVFTVTLFDPWLNAYEGVGPTARDAYRSAYRRYRLAQHDVARLLEDRARQERKRAAMHAQLTQQALELHQLRGLVQSLEGSRNYFRNAFDELKADVDYVQRYQHVVEQHHGVLLKHNARLWVGISDCAPVVVSEFPGTVTYYGELSNNELMPVPVHFITGEGLLDEQAKEAR